MTLRCALLGLLARGPASGYDLMKLFDRSLAFVWPATRSQLYSDLARLEEADLVTVSAAGIRGRREYAITPTGREALTEWLSRAEPERAHRNEALLRVFFLFTLEPGAARAHLEREAARYRRLHESLLDLEASIDWDASGFDRFGRIALENGLRQSAANAEWAVWAVAQVDSTT